MGTISSILGQKSLVVVFAYAPAGLGHLRVTDALYHGLPKGVVPLLLGSQNKAITILHRIMSVHPLIRHLFEWAQQNPQQWLFTYLYRTFLRENGIKLLYQQTTTILDQRIDTPHTMIIVATHFGLAHQIAVIKEKLEKERAIKVILAVQVTDDSPQYIWHIPKADLIFVPSEKTKQALLEYGKRARLPTIDVLVTPYPVSPQLDTPLTNHQQKEKQHQTDPTSKCTIHLAIPISGAAVGMKFFTRVIDGLYKQSPRFVFHVVSRVVPYTQPFLNQMVERPYVKLHTARQDRDIVNKYESVYLRTVISLEITKPSEQCFKALIKPAHVGGSLLLLSEPVGRQEYDNIDFLKRHQLLPSTTEQEFLWRSAHRNKKLDDAQGKEILHRARHWRAVQIPSEPNDAACFITWCLQENIFYNMFHYQPGQRANHHSYEISPHGVKDFWSKIVEYLEKIDKVC